MVISEITDNLYIGKTPKISDYDYLAENSIFDIVNMRADYFWFNRSNNLGIKIHWVPTVDILFLPIKSEKLINTAKIMAEEIKSGKKVLCFCRMGRHRSVAMAASILIALGYSAEDAMNLIKQKRPIADPYAKHIKKTIYSFEKLWLEKSTY